MIVHNVRFDQLTVIFAYLGHSRQYQQIILCLHLKLHRNAAVKRFVLVLTTLSLHKDVGMEVGGRPVL